MIYIEIKDSFFQYDAFHITKAFYPNETIKSKVIEDGTHMLSFFCVKEEDTSVKEQEASYKAADASGKEEDACNKEVTSEIRKQEFRIEEAQTGILPDKGDKAGRKKCKHAVNLSLYDGLSRITGRTLDWGILTGIRPTKIAMKKWVELQNADEQVDVELQNIDKQVDVEQQNADGQAELQTRAWLQSYYRVSEEKAQLAMDIARREHGLLQNLDVVEGYSLYVGIPFCKTRCSYCSFTAYPLDEWVERMDEYLDALFKELSFVGAVSRDKKLNTIYIGGGTPTSLTAVQLDRLLTCIEDNFSHEHLQEITVEAGRPDTITYEKLQVMRQHGVGRISINPQTMQDKTLQLIGRNHSVQEIYDVYEQARSLGFDNINMDLIMGLPGESLEDVGNTLEAIKHLRPESLTVHSLAMKRASMMTIGGAEIQEEHHMDEMIALAAKYAGEMDLKPYYLYRQKNMAGNYENVGYAKVDKAGIYNILIMEEKQSIVATGAGATTKIVLPREQDNIIRIENVKDVNEYITRIDEMIDRKGEWLWH